MTTLDEAIEAMALGVCKDNPRYKVGDYLIIYCGRDEGCCFTVRDRRETSGGWEYDTGAYGWRKENTICTERYARWFP